MFGTTWWSGPRKEHRTSRESKVMNELDWTRSTVVCVCVDWAQWFLSRKSLFYSENIFWFRANIEREGGKRDGAKERERIKWRRYNKEFYDCEEGRPSKDDGFGHGFEASTSREWVPVPKRTGPLKTRRKGACSNAIKTRLDYSNRKEEEEEE